MKPYRVLVTGSRDWTDRETMHQALSARAAIAQREDRFMVVVHGDARGADTLAKEWVAGAQMLGWPVHHEPHPITGAEWSRLGSAAGPERNRRMVELGADACLAFLMPCAKPGCVRYDGAPHESHGAANCAALALNAGIPTTPYSPKG